jgi:hypothetical protein
MPEGQTVSGLEVLDRLPRGPSGPAGALFSLWARAAEWVVPVRPEARCVSPRIRWTMAYLKALLFFV